MNQNEIQKGVIYAGFSYFLWGLLPIYWKLLHHVRADEILANRIYWSFFFMIAVLLVTKKWGLFMETLKSFRTQKKLMIALITASLLVSCNWFIYIWAVNNDRLVEASLGYYINPLVSVLLGMIVFREKLSIAQYVSFALALIGVLIITISYGSFPWVSILLALSFGLYGLSKKKIKLDADVGLALETLAVTPIAFLFMVFLSFKGVESLFAVSIGTDLLLIGAGAATAIPLLYFSKGAQRIPLSTLGFLQFLSPTITLILGVFVYHELFSKIHLISFMFIWAAITLFTISKTKYFTHHEGKFKKGKSLGV